MPQNVQIAADSGIPGIREALDRFGEVTLMRPSEMNPHTLRNTQILIVRSVAVVGKEMLENTPVAMVGSATAGTDHIDQTYLNRRKISFYHAPGANADSVADYVVAALLVTASRTGGTLSGMSLGVVGYGEVGSRVSARARAMGLRVLVSDPPLRRRNPQALKGEDWADLDSLVDSCQIVTLHTPLTHDGEDPTYHLLDAGRLGRFRGILINTARGAVVDNRALRTLLAAGNGPRSAVLDVWEGEPHPDPSLVQLCDVATPHIAGYAAESKTRATEAMRDAVAAFLGSEKQGTSTDSGAGPEVQWDCTGDSTQDCLTRIVTEICPMLRDDQALREIVAGPDAGTAFEAYRANYPGKRLMSGFRVVKVPKALEPLVAGALGTQSL